MIILLSEGSAKSLPKYNKDLNSDRAILHIDDEMVKKLSKGEYLNDTFPIIEMLTGNHFHLYGHSILRYIKTSTIL